MKNKLPDSRIINSSIMLMLGFAAIGISNLYQPAAQEAVLPEAVAETVVEPTTAAIQPRLIEIRMEERTEAEEEDYVPDVTKLNLAYYFPDGADESDTLNSKAGIIFKEIMAKDEAWMSEIYDLSDLTPLQMASRLGRSQESVTGLYNSGDERHNPEDSATWTINSFKRVHITFKDGDGSTCAGFSNVIPIMSMASVYTWYQNHEDEEAFREYAMNAWSKSHSYSVTMGEVYYCSGCMGEDSEALELEELLAEDAEESLAAGRAAESTSAQESMTSAAVTGTSAPAETTVPETSKLSETSESVAESAAETMAETVTDIQALTNAEAEAVHTPAETDANDDAEETSAVPSESKSEKNLGPGVVAATASDAETVSEQDESESSEEPEPVTCPGHVDLYVTAKIVGIEESKGLFNIDSIGNDESNQSEDGWAGWTPDNVSYVTELSSLDWYENYGFSVSALSFSRNPLTESEIDDILNYLPKTLSKERRSLIEFALSSVGRVPYYWGGKASTRDYAGNQFGTVISPDQDGRILKGLDCSGWIGWVYWSATGSKLPYESTSGLAACGRKIQRHELEPGDIVLRTGTNAHVIMFLGWTEDGQILCVHETTGGVNNVTVTERDANWPYYRRIVE